MALQSCIVLFSVICARYLSIYKDQEEVVTDKQLHLRLQNIQVPTWVKFVGNFKNIVVITTVLTLVNMVYFMYQSSPNYFVMLGTYPMASKTATFGFDILRASRGNPNLDAAYRVLREGGYRMYYEIYGNVQVDTSSISGVLAPYAAWYIYWMAMLLLLSSSSRYLANAFTSSFYCILAVFIVDMGSKVKVIDISETSIDWFTGLVYLTSYERAELLRLFLIPYLLSLCFIYSSFIFVDHELHMSRDILKLSQSVDNCFSSAQNMVQSIAQESIQETPKIKTESIRKRK